MYATVTYALAAIILGVIAAYFFLKHKQSYWKRRGIASIPAHILLGSMHESLLLKRCIFDELEDWCKVFKKQGCKYFGSYFFSMPVLNISDRELIKRVLTVDFHHFYDRGGAVNERDDPLTGHLFALSGQKWKRLRQKLTPVFTSGRLRTMFETLVACTDDLRSCLDDSIRNDEDIDIKEVLAKYTTDVIGSCAFGIDCNSFKDPDSEFLTVGKESFSFGTFERAKMFFALVFPSLAKMLHLRVMNERVDRFFRGLVADTVRYRLENNVVRKDFMQLLMKLMTGEIEGESDGTVLTIDQIAAQAFLFFFAGFETSSTTMTFALYELAEDPEMQRRLREEIHQVLERHEGKITYDAIKEMKLLDRVVKETLRKHTPVRGLQRVVTEPYHLPDHDVVLEKNMMVFISVQAIHNDPEFYPNPEVFDPERFTDEAVAARPDFTFLPFGEGPKICIGLRFGVMQTKVGLCRLLMSYEFSSSPKTPRPFVMDPKSFVRSIIGGIWLRATKL